MCWSKKWSSQFFKNLICRKCEGNIGEAVKQGERLYDKMETRRGFTYLGDMVV